MKLLKEMQVVIEEKSELVAYDVDWDGNLRISQKTHDRSKYPGEVAVCLNGYPNPNPKNIHIAYNNTDLKSRAVEILKLAKNAYVQAFLNNFPHSAVYEYKEENFPIESIIKQILVKYRENGHDIYFKILKVCGIELPSEVLKPLEKSMISAKHAEDQGRLESELKFHEKKLANHRSKVKQYEKSIAAYRARLDAHMKNKP